MVKDATFWSTQIKHKRLSVDELLKETEDKVNRFNPLYKAMVTFNKKQAIDDWYRRQVAIDTPFYGVPIPLKMLGQDKQGWLATSSSRLFKHNIAATTDNYVKQLETLGFLPLGQTNAPEFGFKNITDPTLYGTTRNVWNKNYHAGGSSGGAASALASGMYPIACASDGGGSIRIPASFSSLIGLKPTRGSMPTGPNGFRGWQGASINFALTISMRDTEKMFYGMNYNTKASPYLAPNVLKIGKSNRPLKIAFTTESPIGLTVSEQAKLAVKDSVKFLESLGHEVIEIPYPVDGIDLIKSYYSMNGSETSAMMANISRLLERPLTKQDMEPMTWAIFQYGETILAKEYVDMLNKWDQAAMVMERLFETFDLFLTPTATDIAPKLGEDLQSEVIRHQCEYAEELTNKELSGLVYDMFEKSLAITPYTQLANLTGQPAISLPTHLTPDNLPIGIQFMASKSREDLLMRIGYEFEGEDKLILPEYYQG
ncbi:amidase [Vagococcus humatus]|uniref:Amidase n=1 Tax=Vagococcus humatus TaxID=1889241 RepID=A0A429Z565_9ENTE|nr:amidase [Vagococcus humatus]RST88835.1 amidase [Vagococcus humatus]